VARLHGNAELVELGLGLDHERDHARRDHAEVLVLELLTLRRLLAEQRATRRQEIGACEEELAIDQEVLLLGAGVRHHLSGVLMAEQLQHALRLRVERLHRAEQRGLLVERFAGPGHERGGDAQRGVDHVSRARHVPCRVAARFCGGADAAVREAGGVGLALDQELACELAERAALTIGGDERVMLLCSQASEGIEDVRVVGGALGRCPFLHRGSDGVRDCRIQHVAFFDGALERTEHFFRQVRLHRCKPEGVAPEVRFRCRRLRVDRERGRALFRDFRNHLLACACSHDVSVSFC